jgi:hypothetical protein
LDDAEGVGVGEWVGVGVGECVGVGVGEWVGVALLAMTIWPVPSSTPFAYWVSEYVPDCVTETQECQVPGYKCVLG